MQVNLGSGLESSRASTRRAPRRAGWRFLLFCGFLLALTQACQCGDKAPCKEVSDCPSADNKCVAGSCYTPCRFDLECGAEQRCLAGLCIGPDQEPVGEVNVDASTDKSPDKPVGSPDATPDAVADATPDKAAPDAAPDQAGPDASPDASGEVTPDATPDGGEAVKEGTSDSTPPEGRTGDKAPDGPTGVCKPGETRPCYNGIAETAGKGPCKEGKETCDKEGKWGKCEGEVTPKIERCDAIDNDCDGKVDEDFPQKNAACQVDAGECAGTGTYICIADGSGLFCEVKGKKSAPEVCDGKDNDCDGLIDEGYANLGKACFDGQGACKRQGAFVCTKDQKSTECNAKKGTSYKERCNGRDDDCDGNIDEDFPTKGNACKSGVGGCEAQGKLICNPIGNGVVCDAKPTQPKGETCNGVDDDCNGTIDDNIITVSLCSNQKGACAGATKACVGGILQPCSAADYLQNNPVYQSTETACDGKDNDCDGSIDETFTKLGNTCTEPQCRAPEGKVVCDPKDNTKTVCDIKLRKETCANAQDDNCDGTIDEGCPRCTPQSSQRCYFGPPGTEGIGICSGSSQQCQANGVWGGCAEWTGPQSTDSCGNNRDEDCDGLSGPGCGDCPFARKRGDLKSHTGNVNAIASYFSTVVTGSSDNTAKIWSTRSYRPSFNLTGHTGPITGVAIYSIHVVTGSQDRTVRLWTNRGASIRTYTGHTDAVTDVAIDHNGELIASSSADKTVKIWNINFKAPAVGLRATLTHTTKVNAVAFDVHSNYVAAATTGNVQLWKRPAFTKDGAAVVCANASDVVFSPNSKYVAATCNGGIIRVWEVAKIAGSSTAAAPLRTFTLPKLPRGLTDTAHSVEFTADGDSLLSGTGAGRIVHFNFATGAVRDTYNAHAGPVLDLSRSIDNEGFFAASSDKTGSHWSCAAFIPVGTTCIPNNTVRVIPNANTSGLTAVAYSRFSKTIFTSGGKVINQHTVATGGLVRSFTGHANNITAIGVTADGKRLVSADSGGVTLIREIATGKLLFTISHAGSGAINDLAISPGSDLAVLGAFNKNLYVINTKTGAKVTTLTGAVGAITSVAISPNGFYLISGDESGAVRVYSRNSSGYRFTHTISVAAMGIVADVAIGSNSYIYALHGFNNGMITAYRTSGSVLKPFIPTQTQLPFNRITVSPDNQYVAATNADGLIYFWRYSTGRLSSQRRGHTGAATGFVWAFDGETAASISSDKSIRFHDCNAQPL